MNKQEILHKEIDLIQNIINRMANNSFLLKGWLITLIVAVLAPTTEKIITDDISYFGLILILPLVVFWYLDAFFLHKEKCYRELYNWIIENREKSEKKLYSLKYEDYEDKVKSVICIMFSPTLRAFYGITFLLLVSIGIYNLTQ